VGTRDSVGRRHFLETAALGLPLVASAGWGAARQGGRSRERSADVAIVGASVGGCAAALAACRAGLRVILTEETDWIGGQLTSQAVPPDEHPWIESFGCTRSYRQFRDGVRDYYRQHYPLTAAARANVLLNPGNGNVSRLCHEPRVALAVLEQMLAPHVSAGRLQVLLEHVPIAADVDGDRVRAVTIRDRRDGAETVISAPYVIDATELGDLLPLTKTEFAIGAESRRETGEPHAPDQADPLDQQAITWCFPIDYVSGEDHTIDKPSEYAFWRDYVPAMTPAWPGRLLSWQMSEPRTLDVRKVTFDPASAGGGGLNLFYYRRLADPANFEPGAYRGGISLVNWPQNDYWLGPLLGVAPDVAAKHLARSKALSLSLLYWMQTEAPRPDGGAGWRGLRLRGDLVGTTDGLAKAIYVREARRIKAAFTITEPLVGTDARVQATGLAREAVTAARFDDAVGIGAYRIDLHPSTTGRNYVDISSLPFQVPLGALIPQRVENLIAACKNIGTTHLTNGCYRLHPVEWTIGEAAGALVAHATQAKEPPRQIRNDPKRLAAFQQALRAQGFELEWPSLRPL
jgi:hypothetical protein